MYTLSDFTESDLFKDDWLFPTRQTKGFPFLNIYLEDGVTILELATAGFSKEELKISVDGNFLVIEGSKVTEKRDIKYVVKDISTKDFKTKYKILNGDKIESSYRDGILTIKIYPKKVDKIEIKIN